MLNHRCFLFFCILTSFRFRNLSKNFFLWMIINYSKFCGLHFVAKHIRLKYRKCSMNWDVIPFSAIRTYLPIRTCPSRKASMRKCCFRSKFYQRLLTLLLSNLDRCLMSTVPFRFAFVLSLIFFPLLHFYLFRSKYYHAFVSVDKQC